MKQFAATLSAALLLLLAATGPAEAITLKDFNLGTHVYGEPWDMESLQGRTVLVDFWDTG